jgi:hypothetical protein
VSDLGRELEGFALAHEPELTARDLFVLGQAAGIVARVHAPYLGSTFQPRKPLTDSDPAATVGDDLS